MGNLTFLHANGEMARLTKNLDWESTVLGCPERWSHSLRTSVNIVLNAGFPMLLCWGDEFIQFYNDAYREHLSATSKHPSVLGQPVASSWPVHWPKLGALLNEVRNSGKAIMRESAPVYLLRNGAVEETYWTFNHSPVIDDDGSVGGVLVVCMETTGIRQSQKELEEKVAELEFSTESAELGVWDFNAQTGKVRLNGRLREWYGLSGSDDVDLKDVLAAIDEKDKTALIDEIKKCLEGHGNNFCNVQYTVHPGSGQTKIIRARGKAWLDENHRVYRVSGTARDVTEEVTERKKAEESENQLRSFVESAPFPIGVYVGPEMKIQFVNQSIIDVWGKGNDIIGKTYSEVLPELGAQKIYEQLDAVYRTGVPFHAHNQQIDLVVNNELTRFYFNYSFTPLYNGYEIYGVMNTAADVTDLNLANRKLEESEKNLRNTILQAPVAMCILHGPEHIVEIANERMYELWGRRAGEVIGRPLFDTFIEPVEQGFKAIVDDVYVRGKPFHAFATPVTFTKNGTMQTLYLDLLYHPLRETPGKITGVIAVAIDVSEQVSARKKLEAAEEQMRLAIESGELGTYQIDLVTNKINASDRFNAIWGVAKNSSREETAAHIHPDDVTHRNKAYDEALVTGKLYYEARVIWNDLSVHWVKVTGKVVKDENGSPISLSGVAQDITAQKAIDHQKDAFVATVSHELKTPITSMKVYCHLLLEKFAAQHDEKSTAMVSNMNMQINRLHYIIQDLLDVTRIEADKIRFRNDHFDFSELVKDIVSEVQVTKSSHQIQVTSTEPVKIVADKERTSQVLTNLLTNAIRYSPDADKVLVNTWVENESVICSVQDFGSGIEKEKQTKIFDRFYQVADVNRSNAGFGLGLYIAAEIVNRQNGKIWVDSEPGKGSTFYFSLPIESQSIR